jgi:N utilization substance protein A
MVMTARVMLGWVDPTELEGDADEADLDGDDEEAEA